MKRSAMLLLAALAAFACSRTATPPAAPFVRIEGTNLVTPQGEKLFIRGTNLGNWLNPEGYMFGFRRTNSAHLIDEAIRQAAGPDFAREFWNGFKENYITEDDIAFIASTGANTVRLPFHYKLFADEEYMGSVSPDDGFALVDRTVEWCRRHGLYLILDMHDAPGGQTGDNIDDSYGYPWLFESEASRTLFCDIWRRIAAHYRNEPVILGYELMNEPIAPYFDNMAELNAMLEPLYKEAVAAIREVDGNHLVLLGGAQWNSNFEPLGDSTFDDKIFYTCHRYGGDATREAIASFVEFRDRTGLPLYMGEIGHNSDEWQESFCRVMEECNIGYTFWPYKKLGGSSFTGIEAPEGWDDVVAFTEAPRATYAEIRAAVPDREAVRQSLRAFLENCRFANCTVHKSYIRSILLDAE